MYQLILSILCLFLSSTFSAQKSRDTSSVQAPFNWTLLNVTTDLNHTRFPPIIFSLGLNGYNDSSDLFPIFSCGFLCTDQLCDSFLFATVLGYGNNDYNLSTMDGMGRGMPPVIWSANRDRPVKENATLQFLEDGNLILRDVDGTAVWSTDTSGRSVVEMKLTERGSLELSDGENETVWTSHDHMTDTWLLEQTLREGQRLTANASATNSTMGQFYLTVVHGGMAAYIDSNPPQLYYHLAAYINSNPPQNKSTYITTFNMSYDGLKFSTSSGYGGELLFATGTSTMQFMRLESDGHLRHYAWQSGDWSLLDDVFNIDFLIPELIPLELTPLEDCNYPLVCGEYGICFNGACSCPNSTYFREAEQWQPKLGCFPVIPLSCRSPTNHHFLRLDNISYFNYNDLEAAILPNTNEQQCKEACLRNCSCKAALFKYFENNQNGSCYLPSQVLSMMNINPQVNGYYSSAFIKIQIDQNEKASTPTNEKANTPTTNEKASPGTIVVVILVILGAIFSASIATGFIILRMRRKRALRMEKEENFELMDGLPKRYAFEELKHATDNFCRKLGKGGFGSVFEGTLNDEKVAVKLLDGVGQGMKEFLAEVKTIGKIHHVNLVRLIGFCSEKSHKLLIYEYMCNGSLDEWIFGTKKDVSLDWQTRFQIISDVAKGLSYLHDDCRERIAHFDIKPQNILLDGEFHAKVSDFGLSRLIDRELSHVFTTMRGTRGYLAPEWLTSKITEKADVYSFGVVVMEIVCGRKNLDCSQPEESYWLISMLQNKARTNQLLDLVGNSNLDMQLWENEVIKMIKLAIWCLQADSTRRPSMSTVVQALEGLVDVETDIDYNFMAPTQHSVDQLYTSSTQTAFPLSGPR